MSNLVGTNGIQVIGGSTPYCCTTGIVRWNGTLNQLEVMDQHSWIPLPNGITEIRPDYSLTSVIDWAMIKMAEEQRLEALMAKHPGLKDTKEKFDVMYALVKKNESSEDK
jgi:hypothetical protein